jgi:hypothetical protein
MTITVGEMLDNLRTKYTTDKRVVLLRCPGAVNFIELTPEQALRAVDDLENLIKAWEAFGEKPSPLAMIGVQMLLGHDYDFYAGKINDRV